MNESHNLVIEKTEAGEEFMKRHTIVEHTHDFLKQFIGEGDFCIDATAGNGNDTEFLCNLVGSEGRVIALDIQETAIETTKGILEMFDLNGIAEVYVDTHENIDTYAEPDTVDGIVFNLGYLPGGDHGIATKPDSTITAIKKGLELLKPDGIMSVSVYSGGDTGFEEKEQVLAFLSGLDPKAYTVIANEFINKPNHPPIPVFIFKN